MGYYYSQRDPQRFFIAADQITAMKEAVAKLVSDQGWTGWKSDNCQSPWDVALSQSGWSFQTDDEGNIVAAYHGESKSYYVELLDAIAPFVRSGSYLEMEGEDDDDIFRLVFQDDLCHKVKAQIVFE